MVAYLRARTRLGQVAGLWTGVLLLGFNVYAAVTVYAPQYRFRNDFRLLYGAARLVSQVGYGRLYDLTNQSQVVTDQGNFWQPFINPPLLVWLGTPFALAPFGVAIWLWTAFLLAAAVAAWRVAAPGDRLGRAAHLALFAGLFPAAFSVMVGQVAVLVMLAVAAAWWLAEQRRDVLAGVALSALVLKPQLALLVPPCLLVAGRWHIFAGWFVAAALVALLSAVLLGADGIQRYQEALSLASHWALTRRFTLAGLAGTGAALTALQAAVLALALAAAYRLRGREVGLPIAAGIAASLLITPYVGLQDLTLLVLAGWLILRAAPPLWLGALLAFGYAILEFAEALQTWPVVALEAALLVSLLALSWSPDRRLGRDLGQPLAARRQEAGGL